MKFNFVGTELTKQVLVGLTAPTHTVAAAGSCLRIS